MVLTLWRVLGNQFRNFQGNDSSESRLNGNEFNQLATSKEAKEIAIDKQYKQGQGRLIQ